MPPRAETTGHAIQRSRRHRPTALAIGAERFECSSFPIPSAPVADISERTAGAADFGGAAGTFAWGPADLNRHSAAPIQRRASKESAMSRSLSKTSRSEPPGRAGRRTGPARGRRYSRSRRGAPTKPSIVIPLTVPAVRMSPDLRFATILGDAARRRGRSRGPRRARPAQEGTADAGCAPGQS